MRAATPSPPEPTPSHAQTMTAARVHRFGPPDVITLEQIDVPEPREEEVLVRVHAPGGRTLGCAG